MRTTIYNTFDKHATGYEKAAIVQLEIGKRLFERLTFLNLKPRTILDLGSGPGNFSADLKKRYPKATVVSLDLAMGMLKIAKKKQRLWRRWPLVQADMMRLPFNPNSFDLIFANQVVHWASELPTLFKNLHALLTEGGVLQFSTLGPDTFKEIAQAWHNVDNFPHIHSFLDMHIVGDILLQEKMLDPVMDREMLTLHFKTLKALVESLKNQGVQNRNPERQRGLTGKARWAAFKAGYETLKTSSGKFPLSYEIVYGQAWKGKQMQNQSPEVVYVPVSALTKYPSA